VKAGNTCNKERPPSIDIKAAEQKMVGYIYLNPLRAARLLGIS
jgi:hypothetical protein